MEISEIVFSLILGLVGTISLISAWVVRSIVDDVKSIEKQIVELPKEYVFKSDYADDAHEIKTELREQRKLIDQIWKAIRVEK